MFDEALRLRIVLHQVTDSVLSLQHFVHELPLGLGEFHRLSEIVRLPRLRRVELAREHPLRELMHGRGAVENYTVTVKQDCLHHFLTVQITTAINMMPNSATHMFATMISVMRSYPLQSSAASQRV
jgi:hypothetical protein